MKKKTEFKSVDEIFLYIKEHKKFPPIVEILLTPTQLDYLKQVYIDGVTWYRASLNKKRSATASYNSRFRIKAKLN